MRPKTHETWMKAALALATKGRYSVSPNPMVGACLVKNGRLIASGYHKEFGGPHAERIALDRAGRKAKGATLYLTLEPCMTWQKTPPCAPLIVEKGVKEVVLGALDPNPLNHKKGFRFLTKHGVKVVTGILEGRVREQNAGFFKLMTKGRPFVTLKMAQTLDGKIATRTGLSRWISSPETRTFVRKLRAEQDAVLVGKNTFFMDDPRLAVPSTSKSLAHGKPWKVVMASGKEWPAKARVFRGNRLVILCVPESKIKQASRIAGRMRGHFTLLPVRDAKGRVDVKDLLGKLGALGVSTVLVEGGGELAWSLIDAGCVDRAIWVLAPKVFGGRDARTSVEGAGVTRPDRAYAFCSRKIFRLGRDWIFEGTFSKRR